MARTGRALRHLANLSRQCVGSELLQPIRGTASSIIQHQSMEASATNSARALTQPVRASSELVKLDIAQLGSTFAASLQLARQAAPITSFMHLSAPTAIIQLQQANEDCHHRQSVGSAARYGQEDISLTKSIVLTPTRESDKHISRPSTILPLQADSVRRKRKHKMNKHKHKKRRKLQRHKN